MPSCGLSWQRDRKKSKQHRVDVGIQPFLEHSDAVNGWTGADVVAMRNVAKENWTLHFKAQPFVEGE